MKTISCNRRIEQSVSTAAATMITTTIPETRSSPRVRELFNFKHRSAVGVGAQNCVDELDRVASAWMTVAKHK